MSRPERAFTLLEVMAAVAVVAIAFTTLARVASDGLRSEGSSKRRLEASLLADRVLADLEAQVQSGVPPELGSDESEEDLFTVIVDVTEFDLDAAIPVPEADGQSALALLHSLNAAGSKASPLRQIVIRVVWTEGLNDFEVTRTTYGIDAAAIQDLLAQAQVTVPGAGAGTLPGAGGVPK